MSIEFGDLCVLFERVACLENTMNAHDQRLEEQKQELEKLKDRINHLESANVDLLNKLRKSEEKLTSVIDAARNDEGCLKPGDCNDYCYSCAVCKKIGSVSKGFALCGRCDKVVCDVKPECSTILVDGIDVCTICLKNQ